MKVINEKNFELKMSDLSNLSQNFVIISNFKTPRNIVSQGLFYNYYLTSYPI